MNLYLIFLSCLLFFSSIDELNAGSLPQLDQVAYLGDSQVALGGIGRSLSCLSHKNIIAFGNAKASTYVGGEPCKLYGSFNASDTGDLCSLAKENFKGILKNSNITTVAVGLGDNINSTGPFRSMLEAIRNSGKSCVWIQPAQKIGNNSNTDLAISSLKEIAQQFCGLENVIDPSADGSRYETIKDGVHYRPSEGEKIGKKICTELERLVTPTSGPHSDPHHNSAP